MTWDSVDLPEPFGPMMACTSPRFTVSESAWRISRSSTRTCRFLTSSSGIHSVLNLFDQFEALLDARRHMLAYRRHFNSHRLHLIHELTDLPTNRAQLFQHEIFRLDHQPTLPSRLIEISFCASTANSIGSCCSTSFTKPLTTRPTASSCDSPRCTQ